jgi:hypothetical protein
VEQRSLTAEEQRSNGLTSAEEQRSSGAVLSGAEKQRRR